jgi:hypothetical protein
MKVKIKKPTFAKTYGQGKPPKGIRINGNLFEYGKICKVSAHTDDDGNPTAKPYPLIPKWFYEENKSQFIQIKEKK